MGAGTKCAVVLCGFAFFAACGEPVAEQLDEAGDEAPSGTGSPRWSNAQLVVAQGADLRVIALSLPVSAVVKGGVATATATICNGGSADAPATRFDLVVSPDASITRTDPVVASVQLSVLSPGACVTTAVPATFSVVSRSYFMAGFADPLDVLPEESETNNIFVGPAVFVGSRSDLTISLTSAPSVAAPGAAFLVGAVVCNIGSASASSTRVDVRVSTDEVISSTDTRLGTQAVGALAAGACRTVNVSASGAAASERFLGVLATTNSTQVSKANDTALAGRFVIGLGPDLVIESLSGSTGQGPLAIVARVCNQGTSASPATALALSLSLDDTFDAADLGLPSLPIGPLDPGACVDLTTTALSSAWSPNVYRLLGEVDPTQAMGELLESNNRFVGSALRLGPDLIVTSISVVPFQQALFSLSATVCNQGTLASLPFRFALRASVDQIDDAADHVLFFTTMPPLNPGACADTSRIFGGEPVPAGDYFLLGVADSALEVSEFDETNNSRATSTFGLGADLVVESVSASMVEGRLVYSARVCNRGNSAALGTSYAVRLSSDELIDASDLVIDARPLPDPFFTQWCFDVGSSVVPTATGSFKVLLQVDESDRVVELNEANNLAVGPTVVLSPDLAVDEVGANFWGGSLTTVARVCNVGSMPAPAVSVTVRLSSDAIVDGADLIVFGLTTDHLPPGSCSYPQGFAPVSGLLGAFHVFATVDEAWAIVDANRANNQAMAAAQIFIAPDLALANVAATFENSTLTVTGRACNQGTVASDVTPLGARLSADATLDWSDALGPWMVVPVLAPGACLDFTLTKTYAAGEMPLGAFYVLVTADETRRLPDASYTNNGAVAPARVLIAPDLAVANVAATFENSTLTVTGRACNQGTVASDVTPLGVRLSLDATLDYWSDQLALWGGVQALAPGDCFDFTMSRTYEAGQAPVGWFYVFVAADEVGSQPDSDRANNQVRTAPIVFP